MDHRRFDELTRAVSHRVAPRRRVLQGGLAALLAGRASAASAARATSQNDPRCPKDEPFFSNKGQCITITCSGNCNGATGVCAETAAGARACIQLFSAPSDCPTTDECDRDGDCGTGQVCIKVGGCCCPDGTAQRRKCKRRNKCLAACP